MYQHDCHWTDFRKILYLGFTWKFGENQICLKLAGSFTWRPMYFLLFPAKLNRHKSALFDWNGAALLGKPRKYMHHANAQLCYVIRTLPLLLVCWNTCSFFLFHCRVYFSSKDTSLLRLCFRAEILLWKQTLLQAGLWAIVLTSKCVLVSRILSLNWKYYLSKKGN